MWIDLLAFYLCTSDNSICLILILTSVSGRYGHIWGENERWRSQRRVMEPVAYPGGMNRMHAIPPTPPPPVHSPPGNVHPPPLSSLKGWLWEKMRQWATCDLIIFFLPRFILYKKTVTNFSKIWVWDPRSRIQARKKPIPDPGSKGQKGTGSRVRIRNTV